MQSLAKKWGGHLAALLLFTVVTIAYFSPSVLDGKVIHQGDMLKFSGMSEELNKHAAEAKDGNIIAWTGSMFSGMPSYNIAVKGTAPEYLFYLEKAIKSVDFNGASMVLTGLICFYILMCVMGIPLWLAIAGAIAFAFASYNLIIIEAGHITKAYVIAYMPLTIAGMLLLFRSKFLWGAVLFTLGVALSVLNGHLQITYYLALLCLFIYIGFAWDQIRQKAMVPLVKISGVMLVCVILAVLPNLGNLYANWEMSKTSMRGPTELTQATTGSAAKVSDGLDKEYAFAWSYGKGELLTLLVPNAYGGASGGTLDNNSNLYKELRSKGAQLGNDVQSYTYWGDKIFTSGPVYFGAIVCFLFVLGLFVVPGKLKWWMLGGSVFLTLLALGKNFDGFNDFMFHNLPMYNKFRTVEMALVIPGLVFPLIAFWGLKEILSGKVDVNLLKRGTLTALGLTGGICLILWLMPSLFLDFRSPMDTQYQMPDWYYNALLMDRKSLAQADALRSLIFILLGVSLLFWYFKAKNKEKTAVYVGVGIAILMLADLWSVDKRYLNGDDFVREQPAETYKATVADKEILKDTDPSFRVLNLNNPFQETTTSFYHKSIGGYHAAKLRRYQELIDHRLTGEIQSIMKTFQQAKTADDVIKGLMVCPTLNMLNMRYIIYNPEQAPVRNPFAYGNAWFAQKVEMVDNADAEMAAMNQFNPLMVAVVDKRFAADLEGFTPQPDSTATIALTDYKPNVVTYQSNTKTEQLAIFSEIYYQPGWKAFVDGKETPHFRADWTLRALRVPAGEHQIVFRFEPDNYIMATQIASVSSLLILLLLAGAIAWSVWNTLKKEKELQK